MTTKMPLKIEAKVSQCSLEIVGIDGQLISERRGTLRCRATHLQIGYTIDRTVYNAKNNENLVLIVNLIIKYII